MFCKKCGYKNADDANFCVSCGEALDQVENKTDKVKNYFETNNSQNYEFNSTLTQQEPVKEKKMCSAAIVGFILPLVGIFFAGLICGILGIIFSASALSQIKKNDNLKGNGLAIAGLVISIIDVVLMFILYVTYGMIISTFGTI